jgi:hypothetical protein
LCSHPVKEVEVDRLGRLAAILSNLFSVGKASGRERVEVAAFGVGREHLLIAGDLGRDSKILSSIWE